MSEQTQLSGLRSDVALYHPYVKVHVLRNPARLEWKPIVKVEHYGCDPASILAAEEGSE